MVRIRINCLFPAAYWMASQRIFCGSGEMIPAQEFMRHMTKALQMIEEEVGGDLSGRPNSEIIMPPAKSNSPKLLTLNF